MAWCFVVLSAQIKIIEKGKIMKRAIKFLLKNGKSIVRHMNIPSIVNCIKHGFIITGILYDAVCINNKWVHEYLFEKIIEK